MHRHSIEPNRRTHLLAVLRAGLLAGAGVLLVAWPAAAADPSAAPDPSAGPSAAPTAEPTLDPGPTPTPAPTPVVSVQSKLIYRSSAITRQYRSYWCVPASMQTMWNLIGRISNRTLIRQQTLYHQIRAHNRYRYPTLGNDIEGWAWGLRRWTGLPYRALSYASKSQAIAAMVAAIKRTGDPVGIAVKAGTHAWVVLGYKVQVSADATIAPVILGLYVSGPLGVGRDPYPYRYLTLASFQKVYTKYHERTRHVVWEGRYVLVAD